MDFLNDYYLTIKIIHVISVISWMAGLLYLPRLFVNHASYINDENICSVFRPMERKLLKFIMNPAMIVAWVCAVLLILIPGVIDFKTDIWFHIKLLAVVIMTVFHIYLGIERKKFIDGNGIKGQKFYRYINEIPTILMIIIVIMVIARPFV